MSIRVVEYGPFGCQLDRGTVESMDQIPEGYCVVHVQVGDGLTVYIDPVKGVIRGEQRWGASGQPSSGPPWPRPP